MLNAHAIYPQQNQRLTLYSAYRCRGCFSHVPSSVSLLARFFVAISLSTVRQRNVEFSWTDVCRISSVVSSLPVPTATVTYFPLQVLRHWNCTLCSRGAKVVRLLFDLDAAHLYLVAILNPTVRIHESNAQSLIPSRICRAMSRLCAANRHSEQQTATQNKSTGLKFRLSCGHERVHFIHHIVQIYWSFKS